MHYSSSDVCALSKLSLDTGSERERKKKKSTKMTIHIYSLGFIIIIEQTDSHVVSAFFPRAHYQAISEAKFETQRHSV